MRPRGRGFTGKERLAYVEGRERQQLTLVRGKERYREGGPAVHLLAYRKRQEDKLTLVGNVNED